MNDIPEWNETFQRFKEFLLSENISDNVCFVFRDDIWQRPGKRVFVKWPIPECNTQLVKKVYEDGRKAGLVEM